MPLHDQKEPKTCRGCGGLLSPRSVVCRRCGRYRDAGPIESALLRALVPESMNGFAGTLLLCIIIVLWQSVVFVATHGDAFPAASQFTLVQFGAMNGAFILFGQWWRAGTSIFLHHGILHLATNLYALYIIGRILERMTDRYRVIGIFLFGGMASMIISHFWYALGFFGTPYMYTSAGASGAITALIGAAYIHARRQLNTQRIARSMLMWSLFMLGFGLVAGGVNNAAHVSGWIIGALCEIALYKTQYAVRITKSVGGICGLLVVVCFALAGMNMRGLPSYTHNDGYDRQILFFQGKKGVPWKRSAELHAWNTCQADIRDGADARKKDAPNVLDDCRLNVALNSFQPVGWRMLQLAYLGVDKPRRAKAAAHTASRLRASQ